ncbi:hypothetical protein PAPYR_8635 [Paratrimastix pyriformis]|uniref:Uncharacterized protein n=1 Tax=Paratrimastix pyriformis TaxID=342808 RepID=A0ABQ8UH93_9EUKA|nr:hypothetical protein PAPYR_8635 [Paratrimastix pyriformis]
MVPISSFGTPSPRVGTTWPSLQSVVRPPRLTGTRHLLPLWENVRHAPVFFLFWCPLHPFEWPRPLLREGSPPNQTTQLFQAKIESEFPMCSGQGQARRPEPTERCG